jgi:outer membrane protein
MKKDSALNRVKIIAILLISLLIGRSQSYAQTEPLPVLWTLEDCINHAWSNNIQIKQQQLSLQLSKLQYTQSITSMLPNVNGSVNNVYNYGQTLDLYTNQFASTSVRSNNFALSSNVVVFSGLQMLHTVMQKKLDFLASAYDLEQMKHDIALTIATYYLQVLYNMEQLDIAQGQLDITTQQVDRTRRLVEAGTLANGSLLTIQAQQASEEMNVVSAQNNLNISLLTLAQMLDLPSTQGFSIVKPIVMIPDASALMVNPADIYQVSLGMQPGIRSAETKVKSAKKGLAAAYGALSPSISLNGSIGTGYSGASQEIATTTLEAPPIIGYTETTMEPVYSAYPNYTNTYQTKPFSDQISDNVNKSIGLYVSIPIFNRWQVQTGISSAKIQVKMAELNLQNTQNNLNKTIQQAHADALAALNRYQAAQKSVTAYQEAFKYTQQKYDVGLLNSIDYNDAKNKLAKANSDLLQAKYEFVFRVKVLDFYQGKPLTLN